MVDQSDIFLHKLYFILAGFMSLAIIAALTFLFLTYQPPSVEAKGSQASATQLSSDMQTSPNLVTSGAAGAMQGIGQTMDSLAYSFNTGMQAFATSTARTSKNIGRNVAAAASTAGKGIVSAATTVGRGIGNGAMFVISIPGNILSAISDVSIVHSFITPSEHAEVPIIDPNSPELQAALVALPATEKPTKTANGKIVPKWPTHGQITTEFGVNHWPYQDTHTGMDIASGKPLGTLPIHPFRPGKVVDVIYSYYGLGNHVIVDHGSGVTSVYAHLNSISVQKGQKIGQKTVVGFEGTTGLSTGPHLHFEIRVNGMAANPRQFISGNP